MCNGYRHPPDCPCSFGVRKRKNDSGDIVTQIVGKLKNKWTARSMLDAENIEKGLEELGVNPKWIQSIVKKYKKNNYPIEKEKWEVMTTKEKTSSERKFMRLLRLRQEVVANLEDIHLDIPLFVLQPPRISNSKVVYEESNEYKDNWNIFVEVPGFAIGTDFAFQIKTRGTVEASGNNCKIICLPITIKRKIVNLYLGKICIARRKLLAEAGNKRAGTIKRSVISTTDYQEPSPDANMMACYELVHDFSKDPVIFQIGWLEYQGKYAKITLPIPHIKPGIGVKVELKRELNLKFILVPGFDYELYPAPEGMGISWLALAG